MRPGMSCSVEIRVEDIADAITIPVQAVFRHLGANIAFVDAGAGKYEVASVKTDRFNDSHVQITEGLKEGQIVLLSAPATFQLQAGESRTDESATQGGAPTEKPQMAVDDGSPGGDGGDGGARGRMPRPEGGGENAGGPPGGRNFGGGPGRGQRGQGRRGGGAPEGADIGGGAARASDASGDEKPKDSATESAGAQDKQEPAKPGGHR
jgi:hypothetical protein